MAGIKSFFRSPRGQAVLFIALVLTTYLYTSRPREYAQDIVVAGSLAYLATGADGIRILDVTEPSNPVEISHYDAPGETKGLFHKDSFLYTANGKNGLQIIDVSNPFKPALIGSYKIRGDTTDVTVIDNWAFAAGGKAGLLALNVKNKTSPKEETTLSQKGNVSVVSEKDNLVFYIDNKRYLRILDTIQPENTQKINPFDVETTVLDITISGNTAFLATEKLGVVIVDISNPTSLQKINSFKTQGPATSVEISGSYTYVIDDSGLSVWDVTDTNNPNEIGSYATDKMASALDVKKEVVYIADGFNGLLVLQTKTVVDLEFQGETRKQIIGEDVEKSGNTIFLAAGENGVQAFNSTDPRNLKVIGQYDTSGFTMGVAAQGDRLFLADKNQGLIIVGTSDLANFGTVVSNVKVGEDSYDVSIAGDYAFLADGKEGLRIIGFTDPLTPYEISHLPLPGNTQDIQILGPYAYVATGNEGMQIIDIRDLANPRILGLYNLNGEAKGVSVVAINDVLAQQSGVDRYTTDITHPGTTILAFIAYGTMGLHVVDVTDPSRPRPISFLTLKGSAEDVVAVRDTAYLGNKNGDVLVIDVANPANPIPVGVTNTSGQVHGLYVETPVVYVANFERGLTIIDATVKSQPMMIGGYHAPSTVIQAAVQNNMVYTVDGQTGVWAFDVSNFNQPTELSYLDTPGQANYVFVSGSLAFIADGTDGIQIVDLTNPSQPTIINRFDTPGYANCVVVFNNLAYVADGVAGLRVYDISNLNSILELGAIDTDGNAWRVAVAGEYAYVSSGDGGLYIIKITDPRALSLISIYRSVGDIRSAYVTGKYAFLASGINGFRILDISQPLVPKEVYVEAIPVLTEDVFILESYAYLASGGLGVRIIDVSLPEQAYEIGSTDVPKSAIGVTADWQPTNQNNSQVGGMRLFVSDDNQGLKLFTVSKTILISTLGIYETPGNVTLQQAFAYLQALFSGQTVSYSEKAARTIMHFTFDIFVIWVGWTIIWIAIFAQFALPVKGIGQRYAAFLRLFRYLFGAKGMAIQVRNGKINWGPGEEKKLGLGVALVDLNSAIVLERKYPKRNSVKKYKNKFKKAVTNLDPEAPKNSKTTPEKVHVKGPGLTFLGHQSLPGITKWEDKVRGAVDLRRQIRRRPEIHAYTRNGIEVVTTVYVIFTLGEPPEIIKVGYIGESQPQNLRVIYIKEELVEDPNTGIKKVVEKVSNIVDELDEDDKAEIYRFVQIYQPNVLNSYEKEREPVHTLTPFRIFPERIFASITAQAHDVLDEKIADWTELPPHVAVEIFREVLALSDYDDLYRPTESIDWDLDSVKRNFSNKVRNSGVLSYEFIAPCEGFTIQQGAEWDESKVTTYPIRDFQQPKILRSRGIKVIHAGFEELIPVAPSVRKELIGRWSAPWQKEAEITKSDHDLQARRIYARASAEAQKQLVARLSQTIKDVKESPEAVILRLFQALEKAATDPATHKLLPLDTLKYLDSLHQWLLPGEEDKGDQGKSDQSD